MKRSNQLFAFALTAAVFLEASGVTASQATAAVDCEKFAAVIGRMPVSDDIYKVLQRSANALPDSLYNVAPIDGGRYWIRSDYGDGSSPTPTPHFGCFADIRIGVAWVCASDKQFVRTRRGCMPSGASQKIAVPETGCISLPLKLREQVMYCAPGSSPQIN